ncbi:hypothetical protein SAMN06298212_12331 [Ruaniaceae bacterium KH17]|nr:hypothetical protein SAMN06298212_12331 [Ruaniaceae bacterium KH17]
MNEAASLYWVDLRLEPIPDVLDLDYLRMIHRQLLSPVVEWAGELRQAGDEVIAGDTGIVYAMSVFFRDGLDDVFAQLAGEDYLTGLGADEFTDGLAARAPQRQLGRARPPIPRHKRTTAPQRARTPMTRALRRHMWTVWPFARAIRSHGRRLTSRNYVRPDSGQSPAAVDRSRS